jgi:hypothetical protein
MGKKEKSRTVAANTELPVVFPDISPKSELECRVLLENQIVVIDVCYLFYSTTGALIDLLSQDIFSPAECKFFVKFIDSLPLELTPPKKRGEAERYNRRLVLDATSRSYNHSQTDIQLRLLTLQSGCRLYLPHTFLYFFLQKRGRGT